MAGMVESAVNSAVRPCDAQLFILCQSVIVTTMMGPEALGTALAGNYQSSSLRAVGITSTA